MSLAQDIKRFQDQLLPTIPEPTMITLMTELQGLIASGIAEDSIKPGSAFPDFVLPNAVDVSVSLKTLLHQGPLVVRFYRGAWCTYCCNLEINALLKPLPEITADGAHLTAISR